MNINDKLKYLQRDKNKELLKIFLVNIFIIILIVLSFYFSLPIFVLIIELLTIVLVNILLIKHYEYLYNRKINISIYQLCILLMYVDIYLSNQLSITDAFSKASINVDKSLRNNVDIFINAYPNNPSDAISVFSSYFHDGNAAHLIYLFFHKLDNDKSDTYYRQLNRLVLSSNDQLQLIEHHRFDYYLILLSLSFIFLMVVSISLLVSNIGGYISAL